MLKKHILLLASLVCSANAMDVVEKIQKPSEQDQTVFIPMQRIATKDRDVRALFYNKHRGFLVANGSTAVPVKSYDTDKVLRGRTAVEMARFAQAGKFQLSKMETGEYAVRATGELVGGGIAGAAIASEVGFVGANLLGHGVLWGVSLLAGPAAGAVYTGLAAAYGPAILVASRAVAVGCGVAGGVATGPV